MLKPIKIAKMTITVDIQRTITDETVPLDSDFQLWAEHALSKYNKPFELTIRIVSREESQSLNHQYRDKDRPTNVLSFPFDVPDGIELDLIGDLVICADVVAKEALEQKKLDRDHWAHMVIHGCLHLLGFDHISEDEAQEMEGLEIEILDSLGIQNPYIEN